MTRTQDEIKSLLRGIKNHQEVAGPEAMEKSEAIRNEIEADLVRLETPSAYRNHLLTHLKEQRRRFKLDADDEDKRTEPLCGGCPDPYCRIKQGELPPAVLNPESIDEGITQFLASHRGDAKALTEAQEEWIEMTGTVVSKLRRSLIILKEDDESFGEEVAEQTDDDADYLTV